MTGAPRQARPQGHVPRNFGDPTLSARLSLSLIVALVLMVQGLGVFMAGAQTPPPPPENTRKPAPVTGRMPVQVRKLISAATDSAGSGSRDSLLMQIQRYSSVVETLRDSLDTDGEFELTDDQRARFEGSIDDISVVIEQISSELADLELQIEDNTISLLDETGDGIIIRIPEDLDEKLSQGLEAVTQMVLQEFPDSLRFEGREHQWVWPGQKRQAPRRTRIIEGNVVKVGDDLLVTDDEDIRGNVVLVSGSAEIVGRVDGNVVVIFGDLRLDEDAEVTGQVITVGGRLDQEKGARAGDVMVFDPLGGGRHGWSPARLMDQGWTGFLVCQGIFIVMLVVALVAALAAPARRFRNVMDSLGRQPAAAAGVGVLVVLGAHAVVLILVAVLVLTVIGLPLALLLVLAMAVAGVIGTSVTAAWLGELVCRRGDGCPSRSVAVLVGLLLLHALSFAGGLLGQVEALVGLGVALSALGTLVKFAAYAAGLGALTLSRFGGREETPESVE